MRPTLSTTRPVAAIHSVLTTITAFGLAVFGNIAAAMPEQSPCELLSGERVAAVFRLSPDDIERVGHSPFDCSYRWEDDDRMLEVMIFTSGFYENGDAAHAQFRKITSSVGMRKTNRKTDAIMPELRTQSNDAAIDEPLQFTTVENVGDEAAFSTDTAQLVVREDNLIFTLSAYHGEKPPMSFVLGMAAMIKAAEDWKNETLPQRKHAAVELAKSVISAL